ncbi:MAG: hypothetical protein ABIO26_02370 [Croceibacterium sp.]
MLTDESARHPLRALLPASSRHLRDERAEPRVPWRLLLSSDMRGVAQTYIACLFAATAFLM